MAPTVQPDVTPTPATDPGRPQSPVRTALLICLGWYLLLAVVFAVYAARLPSTGDTSDCGGWCMSPRDGFLLVSLIHGLPVLVGGVLVSLGAVAALRRRIRSGVALGTVAAALPMLLLAPIIMIAHHA